MVKRRAALVYNPASGLAADQRADILTRLSEALDVEARDTTVECDAAACAEQAAALGAEVLVAAGGDGTVSAVADVAIRRGLPIGIIARGTANSIAASLGIPPDLEGACAAITGGDVRRIDAARANGRVMVLLAAVGFHADAVEHTDRSAKNRLGFVAYLLTGLAELAKLPQFSVELETEDKIVRCRASSVTVANVAPRQSILARGSASVVPDDGLLDVTIVAADSMLDAVATGFHLVATTARDEPATRDNVGWTRCKRVRIATDPEQNVIVDGEAVGTTPLEVECLPGALAVLVPGEPRPEAAGRDKLEGLPDLEVEPKR